MIPKADVESSGEALSTVGSVGDVGALVEAARVECGVPSARPIGVTRIGISVLADLSPAEISSGVPFASRIGDADGNVAILGALIVTACGL